MTAGTLEEQFTREDIDRVADFVGESTRLIIGDHIQFEPGRVAFLVEGMQPYARNGNWADSNIQILKRKYQEATGKEYEPPMRQSRNLF